MTNKELLCDVIYEFAWVLCLLILRHREWPRTALETMQPFGSAHKDKRLRHNLAFIVMLRHKVIAGLITPGNNPL